MATSAGLLTCPPLFGSGSVLRLPLCGTFPAFRSASGQLPRGLCVDLQQRDCSGLSPDSLIRIAVAKISIYCHNRARLRRFFFFRPEAKMQSLHDILPPSATDAHSSPTDVRSSPTDGHPSNDGGTFRRVGCKNVAGGWSLCATRPAWWPGQDSPRVRQSGTGRHSSRPCSHPGGGG